MNKRFRPCSDQPTTVSLAWSSMPPYDRKLSTFARLLADDCQTRPKLATVATTHYVNSVPRQCPRSAAAPSRRHVAVRPGWCSLIAKCCHRVVDKRARSAEREISTEVKVKIGDLAGNRDPKVSVRKTGFDRSKHIERPRRSSDNPEYVLIILKNILSRT